jgi:hypothetical protein
MVLTLTRASAWPVSASTTTPDTVSEGDDGCCAQIPLAASDPTNAKTVIVLTEPLAKCHKQAENRGKLAGTPLAQLGDAGGLIFTAGSRELLGSRVARKHQGIVLTGDALFF